MICIYFAHKFPKFACFSNCYSMDDKSMLTKTVTERRRFTPCPSSSCINRTHLVCGIAVPNNEFAILGGTDQKPTEKKKNSNDYNTTLWTLFGNDCITAATHTFQLSHFAQHLMWHKSGITPYKSNLLECTFTWNLFPSAWHRFWPNDPAAFVLYASGSGRPGQCWLWSAHRK